MELCSRSCIFGRRKQNICTLFFASPFIFVTSIVEPIIFNNEADAGGGLEYMPNYYNEPAKEDIPDSDWYVPQGAIPQGFELEENLGKEGNQQPVNFQPDFQSQPVNFQPDFQPQPVDVQTQPVFQPQPPGLVNGPEENQPILYDWADYSKNSF